MGSLDQVRIFMSEWCAQPRLDLNNMALFDGAPRHKMLSFRPQFQALIGRAEQHHAGAHWALFF